MNAIHAREQSGFTLIEILLGAVISAMLLAALYAVFQGLLMAQARANARLEEAAPRGQVIALIKKDLENMATPNGLLCGSVFGQHEGNDNQHSGGFPETAGRSDSIEFSATSGSLTSEMPWGEVQKVSYYLDSGNDEEASTQAASRKPPASTMQLVRTVTRNLLAVNTEDEGETSVLFDNVESLEFQYFDGQVWLDAWDSTTMNNAPPKAVSARIDFVLDPARGLATRPIEIVCEVAAQKAERGSGAVAKPANNTPHDTAGENSGGTIPSASGKPSNGTKG